MSPMIGTLAGATLAAGLGLVTFAATSLDNLFLLLGFASNPAYPPRVVRPAYVGSVLLVAAAAVGLASLARLAPDWRVGLLGWIPLGLGVVQLGRLVLRPSAPRAPRPGADGTRQDPAGTRKGRTLVAGVTLAASGDSLAAYAALFADTLPHLVPWSLLGVGAGATAWTVLATWLSGRAGVRRRVERFGPALLPLILIGVGLYILGDTPTDVLGPP